MYEKRIGGEIVKLLTADELAGFFDQPEDDGSFVLDLQAARASLIQQSQ